MPSSYWLSGYTNEGINTEYFSYTPPKVAGEKEQPQPITDSLTYAATSSWVAKHDDDGAEVYRKETKTTAWGETYSLSYTTYDKSADLESVVTVTYVYGRREALTVACGFPSWAVIPLPKDIIAAGGSGTVLLEKLTTTKIAQGTAVLNIDYRSAATILTSDGAAAIQKYIQSFTDSYGAVKSESAKKDVADSLKSAIPSILGWAAAIRTDKTRVQHSTKQKEESLKEKVSTSISDDQYVTEPAEGATLIEDLLDGTGDAIIGETLEIEPELELGQDEEEEFDLAFSSSKYAIIRKTSLSSDTAYITTGSSHGFDIGDSVIVSDTDNPVYVGTHTILATPSNTQFTYTLNAPNESEVDSGGDVVAVDAISKVLKLKSALLMNNIAEIEVYKEHELNIGDNVLIKYPVDGSARSLFEPYLGYHRVSGVRTSTTFNFELEDINRPRVKDPSREGTVSVFGYVSSGYPFSSSKAGIISRTRLQANIAYITTGSKHGFSIDDEIIIQDTDDSDYEGTYTIRTTPSETEFTYTLNLPDKERTKSGGSVIKVDSVEKVTPILKLGVNNKKGIVITDGEHGLSIGDNILIQNTPDASYQGYWNVIGVVSKTRFTFEMDAPDAALSPSSGTVVTVGYKPADPSFPTSSRSGAIVETALSSNVALITTKGKHGFAIGDSVIIQCTTDSAYIGTHTITSTPTETEFTFRLTLADKPSSPSSGTVVKPDEIKDTNIIVRTAVTDEVATITTKTPHGLDVKDSILIQCTPDKDFEGPWGVTGIPTPRTFTFNLKVADKPATASNGTMVVLGKAATKYYLSSSKAAVITNTSVTNKVATVVTQARHGFALKDVIIIQSTTDPAYIGTHTVVSTPSDTELTFDLNAVNKPFSTSTGTIIKPDAIEKTSTIVQAKVTSDIATIVTEEPHALAVGDNVLIQGTDDTDYIGYWDVAGVLSETSFTFELEVADKPLLASTGTVITVGYRPEGTDDTDVDTGREEITPPYISDDVIRDSTTDDGKYIVDPSDALEKSLEYLKTQVALRIGYNRGQSVVHPVEYYRTAPFSPLYISIKGITGQCRTDSTTITFDSTGILVSVNALFWGGVGQ